MIQLQGIAVSPGIAIGEALVVDSEGFRIPRHVVAQDAVDDAIDRLAAATAASAAQLESKREAVTRELGEKYGAIFAAHLQMITDPRLREEVENLIRQRHYSPEYAVSFTLRRYAKVFREAAGGFLAERASDIYDIEKRLLGNLLGTRREELSCLTSPVLVLAHNLTPSETANLDRQHVLGFVTEVGGPGSHTAIVAEGMEIPAVVGTGPFLTEVSGGDQVIIDGDQGVVVLNPDKEAIARYQLAINEHLSLANRLKKLSDVPAETADGVRLEIHGNIEFPSEVILCRERGADGVGLYRTEFLYLNAKQEPTEETHYNAYARVLEVMGDRPVVIRTLDLGADKLANLPAPEDERNPVLGLRSIRLSLRNIELFRTQLRALMRASVLGNMRIMFPMITTILELRQAKMVLADVAEDLEENGVDFSRDVPVGMMVEVPSAAMMIDQFIEEVDFISIGTNDLVQYTLAVDRGNKDVADMYTSAEPAVLRFINMSISAANRREIPVGLCGQMSGNPMYTILLLGMRLRQFSVKPSAILEIKKVCCSVTIPQCEAVASKIMTMQNAPDIKAFLKEELKKVAPELML